MNIRIFNKMYWVRRFGEQRVVKGYVTAGHKDFAASLHIHPLGQDKIQALPEGERMVRRIEGHGEIELVVADQDHNVKGDLLYYHGDWYECISCQNWHTTMLNHFNYQFVIVPKDAAAVDIQNPPTGDPKDWKGETP